MVLTIFESRARRQWISQGVLISLGVHGFLIGTAVLATLPPGPDQPKEVSESVRFLMPVDRVLGEKPRKAPAERLQYAVEGKGGGNTGQIVRKIDKKKPPVPTDDVAGKGPDEGKLPQPAPVPPVPADSVLTILEVDSAVARFPESAAPAYPATMLSKNIQGVVNAMFVVDTLGFVDTVSFKVMDSTHPDFTNAVRTALIGMRFHPAILHSQKVRQLVQQAFTFKITAPPGPAETAKGGKKP